MNVREIAALLGGEVVGSAEPQIVRVEKIEEARAGAVTFLANPKYKHFLGTTAATAVLVGRSSPRAEMAAVAARISFILVDDPYRAFLRLVDVFHPTATMSLKGVHPTAIVAPSAAVHPEAVLGAYVVVGDRTTVGAGAVILHHCVLAEDVRIGAGSLLYLRAQRPTGRGASLRRSGRLRRARSDGG